jgi:EAL domain-containing protein (putative c-di-GMP-specific phosphodiesterase class I)
MTTVAEGVETPEQLAYLKQAGCNESQGYLHSKPIAAAELDELLTPEGERAPGASRPQLLGA